MGLRLINADDLYEFLDTTDYLYHKDLLDLLQRDGKFKYNGEIQTCMINYTPILQKALEEKDGKVKNILDDMEVYTAGRLKDQQVSLTVEELQDYINNIRKILE